MSVCILCVYALFPFGDFITNTSHRFSHALTSISEENHQHSRYSHQHTDIGNYTVPGIATATHEHVLISFISAAFDSETNRPEAPKKINLSLDIHLISDVLNLDSFRQIDSKPELFSIFQTLIVRFSEISTPPPRGNRQ
ncbi:hypothetical protein G3O08_01750 [Cryomorpha ignava]|uniref:Uncharacterized protein n=1 Tax=Cryomorpha ignava TaxID=101383 RepID=A0A7K3WKR0_9FLAO|nr:hypothetical protein [Cryomorpha ignava]NEN22227.1 hypothetical protein [Cryomorpha ignava]